MSLVQHPAPSFVAKAIVAGDVDEIELSNYSGRWVVLFFYPQDFTFVCPTEVMAYNRLVPAFTALDAVVIACSTDSVYTHKAWQTAPTADGGVGELELIHASDVGGRIARDYGVLNPGQLALRAVFLIDPEGTVRHESVNDLGVGRNTDETLRLLKAFQHLDESGEMCPANWGSE